MLYKKIDTHSDGAYPSPLDLFTTPLTQTAIEKTYERDFIPLNAIDNTPYRFKILTAASFLDPQSIRLHSQWSIMVKPSGETAFRPLDKTKPGELKIGVINAFGSLWKKNVNMKLGAKDVFDSNNLYSYRAENDISLMFSEDSKKSSMKALGYTYDGKGKKGEIDREVYTDRNKYFIPDTVTDDAPIVEYSTPLFIGLLQQDRYILSNMEIDFTIHPHHKNFCLLVDPAFKGEIQLKLHELRMSAVFVDLHPGVALEIEKKLETQDARYPVQRSECINQFFDAGKTEIHMTLFQTHVPRWVFVGLVKNANFNGSRIVDPMVFEHAYTRWIQMQPGNMVVPNVQWEMDFTKGRYIRAFEFFHRNVAQIAGNIDCGINRDMYGDGYTKFVFNCTTSQQYNEDFDFMREGVTVVHWKLNQPVESGGYAIIIIGYYDHMIYVNQFRSVSTDLMP